MRVPFSRIIIAVSFSILLLITACTGVPENSGSTEPSDTREQARVDDTTGMSQEKNEAEKPADEQATAVNGRSEESSKGLSKEEIFGIARDTIPDRFLFIEENGKPRENDESGEHDESGKNGKPKEHDEPVVIFHDLNNNGYRDALFLLVEKNPSLVKGIPDELLPEREEAANGSREAAKGSREAENGSEETTNSADERDGDTPGETGRADKPGSQAGAGSPEESGRSDRSTDEPGDPEVSNREKPGETETAPADPHELLLESWYSSGRVPRDALSSISRLYSESVEPVNYYLSVFLQTEDELISMYRIPLGAWKVLKSYNPIKIVEDESMPLCISSAFETPEGIEKNWVIFSRYNKFSTFTLKNSINNYPELRDLDSDGRLDIIKWSRIFEEGTGYETFLTWYRWNGEEYVQKDSANVVRSVNSFLSTAGRLLQAGLWEEAFIHMMGESSYREYRAEGFSFSELFSLLFKKAGTPIEDSEAPVEEDLPPGVAEFTENAEAAETTKSTETTESIESSDEKETPEETASPDSQDAADLIERDGSRKTFRLIVFPKIMENPFRRYIEAGEGPPYRVRLSVRFAGGDGRNFVYSCLLQMADNPFSTPQFFIVPEP